VHWYDSADRRVCVHLPAEQRLGPPHVARALRRRRPPRRLRHGAEVLDAESGVLGREPARAAEVVPADPARRPLRMRRDRADCVTTTIAVPSHHQPRLSNTRAMASTCVARTDAESRGSLTRRGPCGAPMREGGGRGHGTLPHRPVSLAWRIHILDRGREGHPAVQKGAGHCSRLPVRARRPGRSGRRRCGPAAARPPG
jgi:hypothetical protein